MATVREIEAIESIENADAIEVATVGGWKVVVKKGEFETGELAIYCEIDSWIPTELAPFLSKGKEPRVYEGIKGERLRTIKLRGQVSQGLLIKTELGIGGFPFVKKVPDSEIELVNEGDDVSELLNIVKYDPPLNAQLAGLAKGNFPSQIPKTDQERIQNCMKEVNRFIQTNSVFEITEKLEGASMTCYLMDDVFGVCSRNLDLKETEGNALWDIARCLNIEEKLREHGEDIAVQGEIIGPGIQKNIYKLNKTEFKIFDIVDIKTGQYFKPKERIDTLLTLGLDSVPVLCVETLGDLFGEPAEIIDYADGKSVLNQKTNREGIVLKSADTDFTFKAISNLYLLKEK